MSACQQNLIDDLLSKATRELGIDGVGIVRLDDPANAARFAAAARGLDLFLEQDRHGDMAWLANNAERRRDPRELWPAARSAIIVGQSYAPDSNPLHALEDSRRGVVSVYAKGRDYHDVLKSRIRQLARYFADKSGADVKIFVDTAPLMEKPLAALAGLGWQGKHTNLVSKQHGSWLFLGVILTTAELTATPAAHDACGSCQRCLDICPTQAFPAPYQLDARRCIAYLTIEHAGHIPRGFREAIGNRVFGCDDCLAVCPWNKFAAAAREQAYAAGADTNNPTLMTLLDLDDASFRERFRGTPVKRTGRNRVVRNALIAAGNAREDRDQLGQRAVNLLTDPSPIVRGAAVWAVRQLHDHNALSGIKRKHLGVEADPDVIAEWDDEIQPQPPEPQPR